MTTQLGRLVKPVGTRDHIRGPMNALVTLLEYGDFECPYCGAAHPVIEHVRRVAGDDLRFVYRHFPLSNVHPHAERAAQAAEAAGVQRRFWAMHDMLFEHQHALDDDSLLTYAEALGLDVARFGQELVSGVHAPRVREDFLSGVRSGVNGTPTFFIDEVRYDGPHDAASLLAAVGEAARAARHAARAHLRQER
jgi:protein-disulfide isomerase